MNQFDNLLFVSLETDRKNRAALKKRGIERESADILAETPGAVRKFKKS